MPDVGWVLLLIVLGLIGSAILVARRPELCLECVALCGGKAAAQCHFANPVSAMLKHASDIVRRPAQRAEWVHRYNPGFRVFRLGELYCPLPLRVLVVPERMPLDRNSFCGVDEALERAKGLRAAVAKAQHGRRHRSLPR